MAAVARIADDGSLALGRRRAGADGLQPGVARRGLEQLRAAGVQVDPAGAQRPDDVVLARRDAVARSLDGTGLRLVLALDGRVQIGAALQAIRRTARSCAR